ncbi:hypothetical protein EJB05_11584, partial [Eragrostis curvula]
MLRLRNHLLFAVPAASSLHRVLFLSTAAASPARFNAEDFLITRCGLTPAQALKSSKLLTHVKSPSNTEAVLAFLADTGVAGADVAAAVAREPRLLCARVDKTLKPRIVLLRDVGFSVSQISRLTATATAIFWSPAAISRLAFYLSFLGSFEKLYSVLRSRYCGHLLSQDVERVVKPNLAFLQQCGLTNCDIVKLFLSAPILLLEPDRAKEIAVFADKLGVPRHSAMFKHALWTVQAVGPGRVDATLDFLKKALGCSETEPSVAVCKLPRNLALKKVNITQTVEFLKMEVGLKVEYIVHRPALLSYSTEKRLIPRHYVLKVLKAKGLVKKDTDFFNCVCLSEKKFAKRFLERYEDSVPGLTSAYAAACDGQVPQFLLKSNCESEMES